MPTPVPAAAGRGREGPRRAQGLASPGLRREIHGGLQAVETWNSANTVLHYGEGGALTGPDKEHAETSMLPLHLLQPCTTWTSGPTWGRPLPCRGFADLIGPRMNESVWADAPPGGPRFRSAVLAE
ncbi:Tn3 family transposase [Streptomyces sp. NPDC046870]|uniref:Tn3 family transposase n=1 Tax=Streptomyces sp. NPDC046870 TaxID=3155135 RepID=UPI00345326C7